jgi:hypothetical protein
LFNKSSRLSGQEVTEEQWEAIKKLVKEKSKLKVKNHESFLKKLEGSSFLLSGLTRLFTDNNERRRRPA